MTDTERKDFKDLIEEVLKPLLTSFEANNNATAKDIKVLFKQSTDHFSGINGLKEDMGKQVHECQVTTSVGQIAQGKRIEDLGTRITKLEERMSSNRMMWTQIIIIIGIAVSIWVGI